ncbi:MAG TPA: NAD-dependent epimerase/dehydratase family protein [Exilispira sp.]|nr:NAD-dependent epimerase/dehydratase family protein [Exilispira sp.]
MKIFITGATGFLGQTILSHLDEKGLMKKNQITALVLPNDRYEKDILKYAEIHILHGNVSDRDFLIEALKDQDIVIHTAGLISYWKKDYDKLVKVNIEGTKNIVEACLTNKIRRLVHISSVGTVGFYKDGTYADEQTKFNWPENFYYMTTKRDGEKYVMDAINNKGLNAIILNPASIMGPMDPNPDTPHNQVYKMVLTGTAFFSFSGGLAIVDVRDLADIAIKAAFTEDRGKYLIIGHNISYVTVLKTCGKYLNKKVLAIPVPPVFLFLGGHLLEFISNFTNKRPLITASYGRLSGFKAYYSNKKSIDTFSHKYIDFEKTIEDACNYYKDVHWHKKTLRK